MENVKNGFVDLEINSQYKKLVSEYLKKHNIAFSFGADQNGKTLLKLLQVNAEDAFYLGVKLQKTLIDGAYLI